MEKLETGLLIWTLSQQDTVSCAFFVNLQICITSFLLTGIIYRTTDRLQFYCLVLCMYVRQQNLGLMASISSIKWSAIYEGFTSFYLWNVREEWSLPKKKKERRSARLNLKLKYMYVQLIHRENKKMSHNNSNKLILDSHVKTYHFAD